MYRQFKKSNFRNIELPVFNSDEDDSVKAPIAASSPGLKNPEVKKLGKQLSLKERVELRGKIRDITTDAPT